MSGSDYALPVIPDGGWGWVVVIGAFVHHVITHGVFLSIGIIFTSLQDALNETKAEIAWIVSIEIGSGFLSGPITGFLISRYGTRVVSVIGAILGSSGYFLSVWADNVYMLYGTMGLISGVGLGMIIISAIVVVNEYFDTHRSLAAGISMAGTGCGAFLFNPLLNWLVDHYGWQGSLLVMSALILNCIPAGLVYRPLYRRRRNRKLVYTDAESQSKCKPVNRNLNAIITENGTGIKRGSDAGSQYSSLYKSRDGVIELIYDDPAEELDPHESFFLYKDNTPKHLSGSTNLKIHQSYDNCSVNNNERRRANSFDALLLQRDKRYDETSISKETMEDSQDTKSANQYMPLFKSHDHVMELVYDKPKTKAIPLFLQNINKNDPLNSSNITKTKFDLEFSVENHDTISEAKTIGETVEPRRTGLVGQFSLFKNAVFTMTVLAQFLFNFGFYVPFVYLPDKSKLEGIDETSTVWVLSTMGLASIFGRIVFGYIADRPDVNRLFLYTSGFFISGVVTALLPLLQEVWMLYCYAVVFGMFTGMVLSLTPVVLIDLLGLEILPATFGISCLFRGLASLLGSPCAGLLVDMTGQFTAAFIVPGLVMVLGALVMSAARYIKTK